MTRNRRTIPAQRNTGQAAGPPEPEVPAFGYDDTVQIDSPQDGAEHARGEEFLRLFNELDHHVKRLTSSIGGEGFFRRLQWAARDQPQIKRYIDDLMEFSELRNALVHDRHFPTIMIAVPTPETLAHFRRLTERIVRPRRVIPAFASELRVFDAGERLAEALAYMHQGGFTQVAAREEGKLRLLTAAGVTRWLAAELETGAGTAGSPTCIEVAAAAIHDVLAYEKPEAMALIHAGATVEDAVDLFQRTVAKRHARLFAVLITEYGRPEEAPLGIITPADLLDED